MSNKRDSKHNRFFSSFSNLKAYLQDAQTEKLGVKKATHVVNNERREKEELFNKLKNEKNLNSDLEDKIRSVKSTKVLSSFEKENLESKLREFEAVKERMGRVSSELITWRNKFKLKKESKKLLKKEKGALLDKIKLLESLLTKKKVDRTLTEEVEKLKARHTHRMEEADRRISLKDRKIVSLKKNQSQMANKFSLSMDIITNNFNLNIINLRYNLRHLRKCFINEVTLIKQEMNNEVNVLLIKYNALQVRKRHTKITSKDISVDHKNIVKWINYLLNLKIKNLQYKNFKDGRILISLIKFVRTSGDLVKHVPEALHFLEHTHGVQKKDFTKAGIQGYLSALYKAFMQHSFATVNVLMAKFNELLLQKSKTVLIREYVPLNVEYFKVYRLFYPNRSSLYKLGEIKAEVERKILRMKTRGVKKEVKREGDENSVVMQYNYLGADYVKFVQQSVREYFLTKPTEANLSENKDGKYQMEFNEENDKTLLKVQKVALKQNAQFLANLNKLHNQLVIGENNNLLLYYTMEEIDLQNKVLIFSMSGIKHPIKLNLPELQKKKK